MVVETTPAHAGVHSLTRRSTHVPGLANSDLLTRAALPESEYQHWVRHITPASGCTRPVQLRGHVHTIDAATGSPIATRSTDEMPDGVIYKACGNRRSSVCPACSAVYQADAYQLIKAGVSGGKGVPETVTRHPAVFATFTAPPFGAVHTRRLNRRTDSVAPCRARKTPEICPHGNDLRCNTRHENSDTTLGTPLCFQCYDYEHHVIWHGFASSQLWRRTVQAANRLLQQALDTKDIRLSYAKVAEYQQRGAVHFHAVFRVDMKDDAPLPPGVSTDLLTRTLHSAAHTTYTTPAHPETGRRWHLAWGTQFDVKPLVAGVDSSITLDARKVAAYIAKYSTKAAEATGLNVPRLHHESIADYAHPHGTHPQRLIHTAWTLGAVSIQDTYYRVQRWAHQYGYGGHFLTKSRRYSTTFKILRAARTHHTRHTAQTHPDHTTPITETVCDLRYVQRGWKTTADELLATSIHARHREHRNTISIEQQDTAMRGETQ